MAQRRLRRDVRHLTLWTFQTWLALFFIGAGYAKLFTPMTVLAGLLGWARPEIEFWIRVIGMVEIGLALAMLTPLVSWSIGRPVVRLGALAMAVLGGLMAVIDGLDGDAASVLLNLSIILLSVAVIRGRRAGAVDSPSE